MSRLQQSSSLPNVTPHTALASSTALRSRGGETVWDEGSDLEEAPTRRKTNGESKRKKNAQAQADFRKRRKDYLDQLETSLEEAQTHVQHATELHQQAADEAATLREEKSALEELVEHLKSELAAARGGHASASSPTFAAAAPAQPAIIAPTPTPPTSMPPIMSSYDQDALLFAVDDLNVYSENDAPTQRPLRMFAPIHQVYALPKAPVVSPGVMPMLLSPLSASGSEEGLPECVSFITGIFGLSSTHRTPPSYPLHDDMWLPPDAQPTASTSKQSIDPYGRGFAAYAPSLALDPSNTAQKRPGSFPTKSLRAQEQMAMMRKMVQDAEEQRIRLGWH